MTSHSFIASGGRASLARVGLLALLVAAIVAVWASSAFAASGPSNQVVLIPGPHPENNPGLDGIFPTSSYVAGMTNESFSKFSFSSLARADVTSSALSGDDTVVLNEVHTSSLTPTAKSAIQQFVADGGKLLIFDADETAGNDYSWLLNTPAGTTDVGATPCSADPSVSDHCGQTSQNQTIVANSSIISSNPSGPSYVDLSQLGTFTDQADKNILNSTDQRWYALVTGTNARGESGSVVAYAHVGQGLVVYNGFDTDFIKSSPLDPWRCAGTDNYVCPTSGGPTIDWLAQMWYTELNVDTSQSLAPGGLPTSNPVLAVGTPVSTTIGGLPPASVSHTPKACLARKSLRLRLQRFAHLRGHKIIQVDVYVRHRHALRERRHFTNRTLRRLPQRGTYKVTVIATTKRHYHLVASQRYRAC